jgi:tRNA pseudouridine13 synthase
VTTRSLQKDLAGLFKIKDNSVGYAGLKDKNALTTQTFSLHVFDLDPDEAAQNVAKNLDVEVLATGRHKNKLKRGHLLGNNFSILLAGAGKEDLNQAKMTAKVLSQQGVPNFYGEQRFGKKGDNAEKGKQALLGKGPRQKWLRTLVLSAFQSRLFNQWLAERIKRDEFLTIIPGDVAKKTDTGGIFIVENAALDQKRFDQGEITYTGPIYGFKMRMARDRAGELEDAILEEQGLDPQVFGPARLTGSRRPARLDLAGLKLKLTEQGIWFEFALPKGAYATSVMREFTKDQDLYLEE